MNMIRSGDGIALATAATALALPPGSFALVTNWNQAERSIPEFDLEVWADGGSTNLSGATLYGATLHPFASPDDEFVGEADDDTLTAVAHGLLTGDGPFRVSNDGGALPGGLSAGVDYWIIKVDNDTFKVATSLLLALAGTAVALSTDGTGTQTIADTASTQRVHWHSHGLLGVAGDGAIPLTVQQAYTKRLSHRPRVFAYALVATLSAETPENVSAAIFPVFDA